MRILILGGTVFLGRHFCEAALAGDHELTLFHRGRHNPDLFPGAERILADRDGGLAPLRGRRWDAVVDTCGYVPRVVRDSAEALSGAVDRYLFVSTLSVYAGFSEPGADETAPLAALADPSTEKVDGETYGGLKALCERAVEAVYGERACIVRPGLIVGPYDPTDRFTYWVERVAEGGDLLAPNRSERRVQLIDARDLAGWMLALLARGASGRMNAVGPPEGLPFGSILDAAREASGSTARFHWRDDAFLLAQGLEPWSDLPLWIPESDPAMAGFYGVEVRKAVANGLTFRPIEESVRDTLAWCSTLPRDRARRAGITREREREILAQPV